MSTKFDIFNNLKVDGLRPNLIAELFFPRVGTKEPIITNDKLNLFSAVTISHNDRLNLLYNQQAQNIKIDRIYCNFFLNDYFFESKTFPVMFNCSWCWWTHPFLTDFLAGNIEGQIKVKIYG